MPSGHGFEGLVLSGPEWLPTYSPLAGLAAFICGLGEMVLAPGRLLS